MSGDESAAASAAQSNWSRSIKDLDDNAGEQGFWPKALTDDPDWGSNSSSVAERLRTDRDSADIKLSVAAQVIDHAATQMNQFYVKRCLGVPGAGAADSENYYMMPVAVQWGRKSEPLRQQGHDGGIKGRKLHTTSVEAANTYSGAKGFYEDITKAGISHNIFIRMSCPTVETLRVTSLPAAHAAATQAWAEQNQREQNEEGFTASSEGFLIRRDSLFMKDQPTWIPKTVFPQGPNPDQPGLADDTYGSDFGKPAEKQALQILSKFDWTANTKRGKVLSAEEDKWVEVIHQQSPDKIKHRVRVIRALIFVKIASIENQVSRRAAAGMAKDGRGDYLFSKEIVELLADDSAKAIKAQMRVYFFVHQILSPEFVGAMKGKVGKTAERGLELISKKIGCDLISYDTYATHIAARGKAAHGAQKRTSDTSSEEWTNLFTEAKKQRTKTAGTIGRHASTLLDLLVLAAPSQFAASDAA